jgi:uncharacterized protein
MKRLLAILCLTWCWTASAQEVIPPTPTRYFNDYAHVTQAATVERLNKKLEDFEKQTSSQILVAVYPRMQSDSALEEYTVRVFRAWGVGQKTKNNGAVLFVFTQDHKMRIAVGYGLEGAMPDALCKRIIDDEITPFFKRGDYDGGLNAGVTAMLAAAQGEYKGTGSTVAASKISRAQPSHFPWQIGFFLLLLLLAMMRRRSGWGYSGLAGWMIGGGGSGGWSGGGGGGGWSGGGGGFSGGGGSTGGGGASGSW